MVSYQKSENHKLGVFSVLIRGLQAKIYQDSVQKFWKKIKTVAILFSNIISYQKSQSAKLGVFSVILRGLKAGIYHDSVQKNWKK